MNEYYRQDIRIGMKFYIEIEIRNKNTPLYCLWPKLYTQLHHIFVSHKDQNDQINIGIGFPDYAVRQNGDKTLGRRWRLFAEAAEDLKNLKLSENLHGLSEYLLISNVLLVPTQKIKQYHCFTRQRPKKSFESIVRRMMKRQNISMEHAKSICAVSEKKMNIPFVHLLSSSNGHPYTLHISRSECLKTNEVSIFNTFGLSNNASIPHF